METTYDAIVVGGGVSGLAAAALLGSEGKKVLLLERNAILGGRAFTREYRGYVIDNGPKMIVEIPTEPWPNGRRPEYPEGDPRATLWKGQKIGPITAVMEKVGVGYHLSPENDGWMVLTDDGFRDIRELYAGSRAELRRVYELVTAMSDEDLHALDGTSVSQWIRGVTTEPAIIQLFDTLAINTFVENTAYNIAAGCFLFCIKACLEEMNKVLWSAYPLGGFAAITDALESAHRRFGGDVVTSAKVVDVLVENGEVRGVEADIGDPEIPTHYRSTVINAPLVIVTTPIWSVPRLVRDQHLFPWYRDFLNEAARHQIGILGFYVATPEPVAGKGEYFSWDRGPVAGLTGMIVDNSVLDPTTVPDGKFLAGTACYPSQEEIRSERWVRQALKGFKADVKAIFPQLEGIAEWWLDYVAGPTTQSSYGLAEAPYVSGRYRPGVRVPGVRGLYLGSGSLSEYGVGSDQACRAVLRAQEAWNEDGFSG